MRHVGIRLEDDEYDALSEKVGRGKIQAAVRDLVVNWALADPESADDQFLRAASTFTAASDPEIRKFVLDTMKRFTRVKRRASKR